MRGVLKLLAASAGFAFVASLPDSLHVARNLLGWITHPF